MNHPMEKKISKLNEISVAIHDVLQQIKVRVKPYFRCCEKIHWKHIEQEWDKDAG